MKNASLVVVGSGIKFLSHLTNEAKAYIEQSDKILYLVNDPMMKEWIKKTNSCSESLDELYSKYPLRIDCYRAITDCILETLEKKIHLCVVLYGHPSVFAQPGLDAVIKAREKGYYAKLLPGISAEDCLFADLLIDPSSHGCQSYEATDFLIHQRNFNVNSHLILWQVDIIGVLNNPSSHDNRKGAKLLVDYLSLHYSLNHEVILYEAAQYPTFEPKIQKLSLINLPEASFSRITTLYVPPSGHAKCNESVIEKLNMNIADLK